MHLGIWLLQNVLFFDLILLQAIWVDWGALTRVRGVSGSASESKPSTDLSPASWPGRVRALAALLIACWALRIEEFPFTAMQMYSKPNLTGVIDWYAVVATDESGRRFRAPIEAAIPALRDARYRRVIRQSYDASPEKRALAEQFLAAFLRAHNRNAPPGGRIVAVEAQRWRWDYSRHPHDAAHGELAESFAVRAAE
jgi:hypothetical protein